MADGVLVMEEEKECTECKKTKLLTEFTKSTKIKSGRRSVCKKCNNITAQKFRKTKKGLITSIYSHQCWTSKRRGHQPPSYSCQELYEFAILSTKFNKLYNEWAFFGYKRSISPSFDRGDDYLGYSFENFNAWMPWKDNRAKAHSDMRSGINNKISKAVISTNILTGVERRFYSMASASRSLGITATRISACCLNKYGYKSVGGYTWKYK